MNEIKRSKPIQLAQPATRPPLIIPDYMAVLIETVKLEGSVTVTTSALSDLAGFSEKDKAALNSFLRAINARGIGHSFQSGLEVGPIYFHDKQLKRATKDEENSFKKPAREGGKQ